MKLALAHENMFSLQGTGKSVDWNDLIGQTLQVKVLEADEEKDRLVMSNRQSSFGSSSPTYNVSLHNLLSNNPLSRSSLDLNVRVRQRLLHFQLKEDFIHHLLKRVECYHRADRCHAVILLLPSSFSELSECEPKGC